jgi:hypothetical protein
MEKTEKNDDMVCLLLKQILGLGNRIFELDVKLENSEEILSLIKTRTEIFMRLSGLGFQDWIVSVDDPDGNKPVEEFATENGRVLSAQLIEQNKLLKDLLVQYQGWIADKIQHSNEASMANRLYTSSALVKHLPSGIKVDSTL